MITTGNTIWLYPLQYIEQALATTTFPYRWDGVNIVCPTVNDIAEIYYSIWYLTSLANPGSNPGFSLGVGTLLQDYGSEIYLRTEDGTFFIHWRNVKQLTDQTTLPVGGNSSNDTIGFVTVNTSYGNDSLGPYYDGIFDKCQTIRLG
jgi:hypothetical protein